jgi:hypothetical protein
VASLSFRETVRRILPPWLLDRPPTKTVGFRLLYGIIAVLDASMQALGEGMRAAFPELGTPTALGYHGRDRRIVRGPTAGAAYYAAQLLDWLKLWRAAGSAYAVTRALQTFLAPASHVVRVVTRDGVWWTLEADGTISYAKTSPTNWNWDSVSHPDNQDRYWDFWIIVYDPSIPTDGTWTDVGAWGIDKSFGQDISITDVETIKTLIRQWKGAHAHPVCLIWSYDGAAFDPEAPAGDLSLPDGTWGNWSKDDSGNRMRSRFDTARYWEVR